MSINLDFLDKKFQDLVAKGNFLQITKATQNLEAQSTFRLGTNSVRALTRVSSGEDILVFKNDSDGLLYAIAGRRDESQVISQRTILSRHTKPSKKIRGQKEGQVAVLYSVVAGEVREFWVKTAKVDVKVHEIPLETVRDFDPEGVDSGSPPPNGMLWGPAFRIFDMNCTTGEVNSSSITVAASNDVPSYYALGGYPIPSGAPYVALGRWQQDFISPNGIFLSSFTAYVPVLHDYQPCSFFGSPEIISPPPVYLGIRFRNVGDPEPNTEDYEPPKVPDGPNPYEAFISQYSPKVFTLIKSGLNNEDEEFGELKYQSLIVEELTDLEGTPNSDDWRGPSVSLTPTIEIEDSDSCVEELLANSSASILEKTLYSVDLEQGINGQTLKSLLETSEKKVTAILTTQTLNSGVECVFGPPKESKIKVPSPGRGTVEGISYTPAKRR
jgi:hypothetical protein